MAERLLFFHGHTAECHPDCVLEAFAERWRLERVGGLEQVLETAQSEGWPVHVATRSSCADHLEHGDDQKSGFAFGQQARDPDDVGEEEPDDG